MTGGLRARRVSLSPDELAVLAQHAGTELPPDFRVSRSAPLTAVARRTVVDRLVQRGLLTAGSGGAPNVHPSVAADFVIMAGSELAVSTRAQAIAHFVVAYHAVSGPLGASLVATGAHRVELSMFGALELGSELGRVVPDLPRRAARAGLTVSLEGALEALAANAGPATAGVRHDGRAKLSGEQVRQLLALDARFIGSLRALVVGPGDEVGAVTWVAADGGWHSIDICSDGFGAPRLVVTAVDRDDLGRTVAPFAAAVTP